MTALKIAAVLCWTVCAFAFAFYAAAIAREITYVTLADGRKAERRIPLTMRLLLPLAPNLASVAEGGLFARSRERAGWMLVAAGMEGALSATEFLALRALMPAVWGGVWSALVLLLGAALPGSVFAAQALPLALCGVLAFYLRPVVWLRGLLRRRHLEIVRALPFVLDLLTLSVEAGMDFMGALRRSCARRKLDALGEELLRMTHEIQVGTPRRAALRNLAERVRQPDLRSVARALIQADELGVSVGSMLRIQSEQLRGRRFERAERLANEAPVKMLGPLLLCIFPAVFLVLLGPVLLQAARGLL